MKNLEKEIKEILEEFDEIIGTIPGVVEEYKNETCFVCGQPHDKSKQVKELKQFLISSLRRMVRERDNDLKQKIGMLRQWLNERPEGPLTNEDLEYWLIPREKS